MKAYRGVDGRIRIFRPNMNMNRMNLSAKRSGLPTFEGDEFIKCLQRLISIDQEWVPHTEAASLYIRPTLIGIDVSDNNFASHGCGAEIQFLHFLSIHFFCVFRLFFRKNKIK